MKFTYLLINLSSFIFPFLLSFEKKVFFRQYWKYLWPATLITAGFFLIWDYFFTKWGIWSFNPEYVIGLYLGGMPVEEWIFFLAIPYSCVFSYQVFNYFLPDDHLRPCLKFINPAALLGLFITAFIYYDKAYTFNACFFAGIYLAVLVYKRAPFLGKFYLAYAGMYVMFMLVNGLLTALPVVSYNDAENSGFRIYTIPAEDTPYGFLMLLMNVSIMEYFYKWKNGTFTFRRFQQVP